MITITIVLLVLALAIALFSASNPPAPRVPLWVAVLLLVLERLLSVLPVSR